jgi:ribonuclease HI
MKSSKKYYAYRLASGRTGVCDSWKDCEKIVSGRDARFKGFPSLSAAEDWLSGGARYEIKARKPQKERKELVPGIYFDAGTGRGNGVEISVTDLSGENLLHKVMAKSKINEFGKHHLGKSFTNNYGELMACEQALKLAIKKDIKKIFGDSKLVIEYWSRGYIKRGELPAATVKLADRVAKLRKEFESLGGEVGRVSGDDNPADLGFH